MNKFAFIRKMMSLGFSFEDASIASLFNICCGDYLHLSRRSRKNMVSLIQAVKKRYGSFAFWLAYQPNMRPCVKAFLIRAWKNCGYRYAGSVGAGCFKQGRVAPCCNGGTRITKCTSCPEIFRSQKSVLLLREVSPCIEFPMPYEV